MGRSASKAAQSTQQAAAARYADLAGEAFKEAKPQRDLVSGYNTGIIQGGPEAYRVAAPEVAYMKRQFNAARQNVRDYMPAGGQKNRAYRDLAVQQPGAISSIFQKKIEAALDRLMGISGQNTQTALAATGGQSQVGSQLAQLAQQRAAAVNSGISGIANLAGFALGGGFGGGGGGATAVRPVTPSYQYPG